MSRCVLDDEKKGTEVVIGWDPPMQTFFARVWERSLYDSEVSLGLSDPGQRFWTGCGDRTWTTAEELDELIAKIQPYACSHDAAELKTELLADRLNDDGDRIYDVYDGSDGWNGDELPADWKPVSINPAIRASEEVAEGTAKPVGDQALQQMMLSVVEDLASLAEGAQVTQPVVAWIAV